VGCLAFPQKLGLGRKPAVKRYGRKIKWTPKAVLGFGTAVLVILAVSQIPKYLWVWMWGPDTGYRSAGLSSGYYERKFPAVLRGMPMIGFVLVGGGERLVFDYDLELVEGKAAFNVWKWPTFLNRPHRVGPRLIGASETGRIEFTSNGSGFYQIFMYAHSIQGSVSVDWRTEDGAPQAHADRRN